MNVKFSLYRTQKHLDGDSEAIVRLCFLLSTTVQHVSSFPHAPWLAAFQCVVEFCTYTYTLLLAIIEHGAFNGNRK